MDNIRDYLYQGKSGILLVEWRSSSETFQLIEWRSLHGIRLALDQSRDRLEMLRKIITNIPRSKQDSITALELERILKGWEDPYCHNDLSEFVL